MAEPARKLDDQENVYDQPDGSAPSKAKPDLRVLEGGGESTKPKTGHLKDASKDEPTSDELNKAESAPESSHPNTVGKGYTGPGLTVGRFTIKGFTKKRAAAGGGAGILVAAIITIFLFLLPALRLESYLSSINQRVFGFAANAVSERTQNLFGRYMITHVLALERCNNKITNNCRADYSKSGYATSLFNAWRDAKVEQKLIDEYGLTFETHKNPGPGQARITIRSSKTGEVIKLTEGQIANGNFEGGSRVFGKEVNAFLKKETKWYEVMQRRSIRKYLVRKHNAKFWCFFKCAEHDKVDAKIADAKTRFKYWETKRFIYPFSAKYGFIMDCLISGGNTDPGGPCSTDELRKRGVTSETISDADLEKVIADFKENPDLRLSQVIIQRILEKILQDEVAAKSITSAVPIAGQIYFAVSLIDMYDRIMGDNGYIAKNTLSKYAADITSSQYLEYYTAMRSTNDEMKEGLLAADEVGAANDQFSGPHDAEESKIYNSYNGGGKSSVALLSGKVLAATTASSDSQNSPYICANDKPIPDGELVCPEKKVARTYTVEEFRNNTYIAGFLDATNTYECVGINWHGCLGVSPRSIIRPVLEGVSGISGFILRPLLDPLIGGIRAIPGIGNFISFLENQVGAMARFFFNKVFPLPLNLSSWGRERYDGLWAGGSMAAFEFAQGGQTDTGQQYGLGGKNISPADQNANWSAYNDQEQYDYEHSGLLARITDLSHQNSLASQAIALAPTNFSQIGQRFISIMSNPFRTLSFSKPAFAANNLLAKDPFGIPRTGYSVDDPSFTADPAIYTDEYCKGVEQAWEASKTEDPLTGFDQYSTTNPCLLEKVSVEAASSLFTGDDSLN